MPDHPFTFDILVKDDNWTRALPDADTILDNILNYIAQNLPNAPQKPMELSITLIDDSGIQELNREYRGKDKPTNVLSFPQIDWDQNDIETEPFIMLGDVVATFETIEREAIEQNKTFNDHFTHMMIHSVLHLFGYDHEHDAEAKQMETLEIHILNQMSIKNPYHPDQTMR